MQDLTGRWEKMTPSEIEGEVTRLCEAVVNYNKPEKKTDLKLSPDELARGMRGLRGLWCGIHGQKAFQKLDESQGKLVFHPGMEANLKEQVMAAAFPQITSAIIASKVLEGYNEPRLVGDNLVTVMPSNRRNETIAGFTEAEGLKEVKEGMEYEYAGLSEKYVLSKAKKFGRLIAITAEAILEDQTGQLLMRAQRFGKEARIHREKIILGCIIDLAGYVCHWPNGVSTAVYAAGNTVGTNALVDFTDVDAARAKLAAQVDSNGNPIFAPNAAILCPDALKTTAAYILSSIRKGEVRAATAVHIMPAGGMNEFLPIADVYASPFLDLAAFGNSATTWYYGSFKDAFVYQEVWPIQVLSRAGDSDAKWMRDIEAEYKVRLLGGAACVDNKYIIKNTG